MSSSPDQRAPAADPRWVERFEVVAEVTTAFHCANHIRTGENFVFDLCGRLDAARSSANLCLGIIAKLQPALMLIQDRAAEGLHPISPGFKNFDCFDTGIDHGGTGKVYVDLYLRDRTDGSRVDDAAAAMAKDGPVTRMTLPILAEADVVVVGAGSAGSLIAAELAATGTSVAVIEAGGAGRDPLLSVPLLTGWFLRSGRYTWPFQTARSATSTTGG